MDNNWELSRRRFLGGLGAASLVGLGETPLIAATAAPPAAAPPQAAAAAKVLPAAQAATLEAIAEQIIPADQDPGARDAGVMRYINNVLAGEQKDIVPLYLVGLEGTDQTSQLFYGQDFVKLTSDQQIAVLKSLEDGTAQGEVWRSFSSRQFFAMVWNHVLEGYYGSPREGGNKNYASWKMMGFPEHSGMVHGG